MDFVSQFLAIILLLALVTHLATKKAKRVNNSDKGKKNRAPEPSGAWPFIGHLHLLGGQEPVARTLGAMADKYGPIYALRLGSHGAVVVSSWEAVKDCFTTNDKIFTSRPTMAVGKYFYDHAIFALAPYGSYWRDVRKMVTLELMTSHRLQELKHVRASEVEFGTQNLHVLCTNNGDCAAKVNMTHWFEDLTSNISIRMLAGKRFSASTNGKIDAEVLHFKQAIKNALFLGGAVPVSDCIPSLEWMDIGGYIQSMRQTCKDVDRVIGKWLEEHINKRKDCDTIVERDFMDVMLSRLGEDTMLSGHRRDTIIKATTMILIMTGTESTAETLIWALSLLVNNPESLKAAQKELDVHVGKERMLEESDIKNLTYLQAIVKETLRLYPPGPLSGPREASEDCYVGGYHVPKGTRLIVNLWKLHRDPRVWSDPLEFRPERFLNEHANINIRGLSYEYIPFSSGRRMCPGLLFGLQVVQLTLARLLHAFDISAPMGLPVDMSEGVGIALPKVKPLEVILSPRLAAEIY